MKQNVGIPVSSVCGRDRGGDASRLLGREIPEGIKDISQERRLSASVTH